MQGATTVTAGQIRPGDTAGSSVGTLTFGNNLTFAPPVPAVGAVATVADLKIFSAGSADKIVIQGDLVLNSNSRLVVTLDTGYTPVIGDTWDLIDWTGVLTLNDFNAGPERNGTADNETNLDLPDLANDMVWNISDFGGSGALTFSIVAVPEPSRALFMLGGIAALLLRRRRSSVTAR